MPIEIIFDSQGQRLSLLSKLAPEKRVVVGFEANPRQRRAGKLDDRTDGEALNFAERNGPFLQHAVQADEGAREAPKVDFNK